MQPKYKISLYKCPANFPFVFAVHTWFVISKDRVEERYEIAFPRIKKQGQNTYFYKNFLTPNSGINVFPFLHKFFWQSYLVGSIEGGNNSEAEKIYNFIINTEKTYPYSNKYFLLGPNSNTYTSYVLKNFPNFPFKLPWNAVGKNYI